ncbi:MAG: type II toxin-antitoxin system RelE/ParE family toxin [Xanthomonadales bacterium]|nr:type II toxin-antitoxin system RelE/ParE family toxin [Xanthomonadales bacterium]
MIFIETSAFTRRVKELLNDDEYARFQTELACNPSAGAVIEGTGGLRKVRVALAGGGKRGGARVIYYHLDAAAQIRLLLIYSKSESDDLTAAQKAALKRLIEEWK